MTKGQAETITAAITAASTLCATLEVALQFGFIDAELADDLLQATAKRLKEIVLESASEAESLAVVPKPCHTRGLEHDWFPRDSGIWQCHACLGITHDDPAKS